VKLNQMERLSILACVTGLVLLAVFFAAYFLKVSLPDWLPLAIAGVAGFELFMTMDAVRRRWLGGGLNG
jgi:predicted PurR-regulated permease PerM